MLEAEKRDRAATEQATKTEVTAQAAALDDTDYRAAVRPTHDQAPLCPLKFNATEPMHIGVLCLRVLASRPDATLTDSFLGAWHLFSF